MRPLLLIVATVGLALAAQAAAARGRDAKHFRLPQYDRGAMDGLLAAPNYDTRSLDRMIDVRTSPGGDVVDWRFGEAVLSEDDGSVDRWTMALSAPDERLPPALAATLAPQLQGGGFEISYTREWPSLLEGSAGDYDFDLSPHAGVGLSNAGHSAEAGATIRFGDLGRGREDGATRTLRRLGLSAADGRTFGGRGRWYLFAGASGASIGVNVLHDPYEGGWRGAGLSSDAAAGFVTSAQAGVAWRQGPAQASLGYVRRKIRIDAPHPEIYPTSDNALAFSFAIKPQD